MMTAKRQIRVLFIGELISSHAQSWIGLLDKNDFEVAGFLVRGAAYPQNAPFKLLMSKFASSPKVPTFVQKILLKIAIAIFKPDIIHCFSVRTSGVFYGDVLKKYDGKIKRVLQLRGGTDFLGHEKPQHRATLENALKSFDRLIADNDENYRIAGELGWPEEKRWPYDIVPGSAGVDLSLFEDAPLPSKAARKIIWPKAYEWQDCKGLQVLEGIKLAWPKIKSTEFVLAVVNDEMEKALADTDPEITKHFTVLKQRVPREKMLEYMKGARVVMAPSVLEGIPNTLYEAMAARCVPIYSPLETFAHKFTQDKNILYANNAEPQEIADALIKAMNDDELADSIVQNNIPKVGEMADKNKIRERVTTFYKSLVA